MSGRLLCRSCAAHLVAASPIGQHAQWARLALFATAATKALQILMFAAILLAPAAAAWLAGSLSLLENAVGVATIITFIMWMHSLVKLTQAYELEVDATPTSAVLWWFVPFANLVKPFQILRQALVALRSEAAVDEARLGWWWGLWLVGNLVGVTLRGSVEQYHPVQRAILSLVMTGISAYLGARMISVMQAALRDYSTPEPVAVLLPQPETAPVAPAASAG